MNNNRWIANKFGLIDFWYYDDEEFELSDGKLLFRGSNGSGKSVTMQSFIPLLLDGNKSPERLDPFGTRSRKLENYLLDEEIDERTAYLYTEFKRENTETYITIGMGLKAQTGKPMDAWYFIISDGRRVGKDIYLYKKFEEKVALTKKQLQNELGTSNFYTEAQGKYMAKVNEMLFGFEEVEGYEELLNLLIQLRSPKLSKDFKPTEIYNILSNSLKLLSEDDLRPMSESMENMDQLQSSLEEKERALKASNSIKFQYDKYNRFCLYEKAKSYDLSLKSIDEKKNQLKALNLQENKLANELLDNEVWNQKEIEENIDITTSQMKNKLNELVEISEEFSFNEGQYLEKEVMQDLKEYDFAYIDAALQKAVIRIKEAKRIIKEYEALENNLNIKQMHCDDLKSKKEYQESELLRCNTLLTETKEEQKDQYNGWNEKNKLLKIDKIVLFELFKLINEIEGSADNRVISELDMPVTQAYNIIKGEKTAASEFEKRTMNEIKKNIEDIKEAIEALKQQKDVEPMREEGVLKNRQRLVAEGIPFIPLYKAIDFNKGTSENMKDAIESVLNEIGILDALIINAKDKEKVLGFDEKQWDKYIFTQGNMMSYNLSNYCEISKEMLNGVSKEEVYNILQSIYVDDENIYSLDEKGNYTFGPLRGKASEDYQAKYIGAMARKRHREQLIEQKNEEIRGLQSKISDHEAKKQSLADDMKLLDEEYRARPSFEDIKTAVDMIATIVKDITDLENNMIKAEEELFNIIKEQKNLKGKLYEAMQGLAIEKTSQAFEEAEEASAHFREILTEAKILQAKIKNLFNNLENQKESIELLDIDIDNLYREIILKKEKLSSNETEERALQDSLSTFDIGSLEADMERCIHIQKNNPRCIEGLQRRKGEINTATININQSVNEHKAILLAKEGELSVTKEIFLEELSLKYVLFEEAADPLASLKKALQVMDEDTSKDKSYYSDKLIEAYHDNSGELREFSPKIIRLFEDESNSRRRIDLLCRVQGKDMALGSLIDVVKKDIEELNLLISTEERRIFEEVLLNTISSKISSKIYLSRQWVDKINTLMESMNTSSSLALSLKWVPKRAEREDQLDISDLLEVLERRGRASDEDMKDLAGHFGDKVKEALHSFEETGETKNYQSIINNASDFSNGIEWLISAMNEKNYGYNSILKEYNMDSEALKEKLYYVMKALETLDYSRVRVEPLPLFSSKITKDPHYFDIGTTACRLLMFGICYKLGKDYPQNIEETNELLYSGGIARDEVSIFTTIYGIKALRGEELHKGWQAFHDAGEPLHISIKNLNSIDQLIFSGNQVYIFENPVVLMEVISRIQNSDPAKRPALICTSGQLNTASLMLLDKLYSAGATLYYSGDFDPEGIKIADKLKTRYGDQLILWRYTREDYLMIKGSKTFESRIQKLSNIENQELIEIKQALEHHKVCGYQELLIDQYVQDILSARQGKGCATF